MNLRALLLLAAPCALGPLFAVPARAADRAAECADRAEKSQILRDERKLVEARELMVACAQIDCPAVVRESCTEWLADVERRVPQIVVSAKDPGARDLANVRVTIDGARASEAIATSAVRLNPGTHAFHLELAGYRPHDEEVVLREGEGLRVLRMTLDPEPLASASSPPAPPTAPPSRAISPVVYVLGGAAVVGAGFFAYFAASGASEYGDLKGQCAPHCTAAQLDVVRTRFLVADVALVASLVTLAGAAAFYLFAPPRPSHPESSAARAR